MSIRNLLDEKTRTDKMQEFVDTVYRMGKYWAELEKGNVTISDRIDGLVFSILAHIDSEYMLVEETRRNNIAGYLHEIPPSNTKKPTELFSKISDIIKTESLKERADKIQMELNGMATMCSTIMDSIKDGKYKEDLIYLHVIGNKEITPHLTNILTTISLSKPQINDIDMLTSNKFYESYRESIEQYMKSTHDVPLDVFVNMYISTLRFLLTSIISVTEHETGFVEASTPLDIINKGLAILTSNEEYDKYVSDYSILLVNSEIDSNKKQIDMLELIYSVIHVNGDVQKSVSRKKLSQPDYIKSILENSIDTNMPINNIIETVAKKLNDMCDIDMYSVSECDFCMTIIKRLINTIKGE